MTTKESFKSDETFSLRFDDQRVEQPPTFGQLQCRTQGQVLFIGRYWMYALEARVLRDWLTKVLPAEIATDSASATRSELSPLAAAVEKARGHAEPPPFPLLFSNDGLRTKLATDSEDEP